MKNNTEIMETETFRFIEMFGKRWKITITDKHSRYGERRWSWKYGAYQEPRTRVFVNSPDEFDALATAKAPLPVGGMFPHLTMHYGNGEVIGADETVWTRIGDFPEVDTAWNRHNRAFVKGQASVLRLVADIVGVDEFTFSRYAGCTCPCSSGFLAKSGRNHKGTTIWVKIEEVS